MHPQLVLRFIGILIFFLGVSMAGPLLVSLIYKDGSTWAIFYSMLITSGTGLLFFIGTKKDKETHLSHRDGVAIVTFGWVAAGLVGAIPFLLSGSGSHSLSAFRLHTQFHQRLF
jgi:trk system potassium uptake protein TrkH